MTDDMVTTTRGPMRKDALDHRAYSEEHEGGTVHATEYWLDGEMIHRSVEIVLKGKEFSFEGGFGNG